MRFLASTSKRAVHLAERPADTLAQCADDRDASDKNQRQHDRVFNSSWAILTNQESGDRRKEASHGFYSSSCWTRFETIRIHIRLSISYFMSDVVAIDRAQNTTRVLPRQHQARGASRTAGQPWRPGRAIYRPDAPQRRGGHVGGRREHSSPVSARVVDARGSRVLNRQKMGFLR